VICCLVLAVFAACVVESVKALTIVLALGLTRGWRSTLRGVAAGLIMLAIIVGALGPALTIIPIDTLRLIVGGLLLVFGLGWLRKAILRASGFKARHDEEAIYDRQRRAAESAESGRNGGLIGDAYAFTLAFKGVLLEGLEVAFIVLTFGANQHNIPLAAIGLAPQSFWLPVSVSSRGRRWPEYPGNTLKFAVGGLLTSFGTFGASKAPAATGPVRISPCWLSSVVSTHSASPPWACCVA
jgi:uncharacterized membrane protein